MFLLARPSKEQIDNVLADQQGAPFSYPDVGASRSLPPAGYTVDRNRVKLGDGQATFERAVAALRRWEMFDLGWIQLCWPDRPIAVGTTVAVLASLYRLWSLNCCRIVYVVEDDGPVRRYGFAYGTLAAHEERGEERFLIEWDRDDDAVWYDILAFSRPHSFLARIGYPAARLLQKRFARDSKRAMIAAVVISGGDG